MRYLIVACLAIAIGVSAQTVQTSDAQAVLLAQQAFAALTRGTAVNDVTLNATVISILGSDNETGTGTFSAKGMNESRIDLNLNGGTRSDVRNTSNGIPAGAWAKDSGAVTPYATHNCWVDAAWFFPALSSLTQTAHPNFIFKYVGLEQHRGVSVQHIRVLRTGVPVVTNTDFYLDAGTLLPSAIGFNLHADNDLNTNVPNEIRFANYQLVNGIEIPFHFQQISNGSVILDATVTSATVNSGLVDSSFLLQ